MFDSWCIDEYRHGLLMSLAIVNRDKGRFASTDDTEGIGNVIIFPLS